MSDRGRLLGVDYGDVRIGIAVCDIERRIASPLMQYERGNGTHDAEFFRRLVQTEEAVGFVIGLPVSLNDTEGSKAKQVREFGAWLTGATGLPVEYWDERFTSVFAESALREAGLTHKKRKARRDPVAAQIMLQGYIDAARAQSRT